MGIALRIVLALTISLTLSAAQGTIPAGKIHKEKLAINGETRAYYLLVPTQAKTDTQPPLIVLLHGFVDGRAVTESWAPVAKRYGIILLAPNSHSGYGWAMRDDGPDFLRALIERVRAVHPVDSRRMYVFGAAHGAMHALALAVLEPEYFAAIATDRGVLMKELVPHVGSVRRKIPIAMWADRTDKLFPVGSVRATRDVLNRHGFGVTLTEIAGHSGYGEVNQAAWEFLRKHRLDVDPKLQ